MWTGERNNYQWLVALQGGIGSALKYCPEIVLGKYLVIAAFDGWKIQASTNELASGWQTGLGTMSSPLIKNIGDLPYADNDEWYIFNSPQRIDNPTIFTIYGEYTLRPPNYLLDEADESWDKKGIKEWVNTLTDLQETFWWQMEKYQAESYILAGDVFIFVTKQDELFNKLKNSLSS